MQLISDEHTVSNTNLFWELKNSEGFLKDCEGEFQCSIPNPHPNSLGLSARVTARCRTQLLAVCALRRRRFILSHPANAETRGKS